MIIIGYLTVKHNFIYTYLINYLESASPGVTIKVAKVEGFGNMFCTDSGLLSSEYFTANGFFINLGDV